MESKIKDRVLESKFWCIECKSTDLNREDDPHMNPLNECAEICYTCNECYNEAQQIIDASRGSVDKHFEGVEKVEIDWTQVGEGFITGAERDSLENGGE